MAITVYRSTDTSAPTMSGTIGSLITVLDACLINGYGTQTAAGWTKPFSGTNLAVYRMASTSPPATGMYLRVDDTAAQVSRVRGYQSMSDVNTGTIPFPTDAQLLGGLALRKSVTAAATARPWVLVADNRGFYLFIQGNMSTFGTTDSSDTVMFFGDIITNESVDGNECVLIASTNTATTGNVQTFGTIATTYSAAVGHYVAKQFTGLGGAWPVSKIRRAPSASTTSTVIGPAVTAAYPDPITGGINLFAIEVIESNIVFRGLMPGLYEPYGGTNVGSVMDTFNGSGTFAGQTFILLPVYDSAVVGRVALRTNGTWY